MATTSQVSTAQPAVRDLLSGGRTFSFEFFPPKDDVGELQLWETIRRLEGLGPSFVSVTYGAGGSTRDRTARITGEIQHRTTLTPVAHLTCVGAARPELRSVVGHYVNGGVRNILALRGDPPGGPGRHWVPHPDGFTHAVELVEFVRGLGDFSVGVAASTHLHPESSDLELDARVLADKARAGADYAITQLFFEVADYERLVERVARHGATIPIIAGLMPITRIGQIERFTQMSGVPVPQWLVERLHAVAHDPAQVRAVGIEATTQLVLDLIDAGVPGIHTYTLNHAAAALQIFRDAGLTDRAA